MKLAFVTTYDGLDPRSWSGTSHVMARRLGERLGELHAVGPLADKGLWRVRARQALHRLGEARRYLRDRDPVVLAGYARQVAARLAEIGPDVVLSPGTIPIAYLETDRPVAFWTDATFAGFVDFGTEFGTPCWEFSRLAAPTIRHGHAMEQAALARCALAIYSSEWAARSAITRYGLEPSKVHVVPFGANLPGHCSGDDVRAAIAARPARPIKLLFVGVDWHLKGGDVAVAVAAALNEAGLPTELTLVGSAPAGRGKLPAFVRSMGFLDKRMPADLATLERLYAEAHFLVLPTRADATPVVVSEANAYGVPCLASRVGGLPSIVTDDVNGRLFPPDAVAAYAAYVAETMATRGRYQELARSAFNTYDTLLNWDTATRTVAELLREVAAQGRTSR